MKDQRWNELRHRWYELRHGWRDQVLQRMADAYRQTPDAAHIFDFGKALLVCEDYEAAWRHFQSAIQTYRGGTVDGFHGCAGAAKWCLNQREEAVAEWRRGLRCGYSDPARLNLPLLLYLASVIAPDLGSDTEARKLLAKRLDSPMARYWPGPVAQFALDRIDESALLTLCTGRDEKGTLIQNWHARFYIGVRQFARGDVRGFREAARSASTVSDEDFDPDSPFFGWKFGHYEFYIARHESRNQKSPSG
jgi:lipoprotein NlpI